MPGLTIATGASPSSATATAPDATPPNPGRSSSSSAQASSPSRPPVSPITPTREHAQLPGAGSATKSTTTQTPPQHPDFALGRPLFTHTTQTDQVAVTPPRAQPIDFDSNPDVLALRSAITILQLQKARATADIQSLSRAKEAALAHPAAFAADLDAGRVRMAGDPLLSRAGAAGHSSSSSSTTTSSSSSSDEDHLTHQPATTTDNDGDTPMTSTNPHPKSKPKPPKPKPPTITQQPWQTLPTPKQSSAAPINWTQYAVVGASLDKLHAEQVAAPTPGQPMVLGAGGAYEFGGGGGAYNQTVGGLGGGVGGQGGSVGGEGEAGERLVGVAAKYDPLRDRVERKGRKGEVGEGCRVEGF